MIPLDELIITEELSDASLIAINAVRSSGGDVPSKGIKLLARIDSGELSHDQAIEELKASYEPER
jgi:hypothetical protein